MDSPAFEELLREIMLSKFYGKSIVELKFTDKFEIASIDRRHLDTEKKQILINQSDTDGISYEDDDFILNIGNDKDLGLLARTAPHAIFKRNGGADYAQFCELFGIPQLIGTYDPEDENGKVEMEEAFQKRGSAGSVVMSKNSSITSIDAKQVNGAVHKDFLEYCNKEILIATQGQTMTTTDGTSLAQAKVHAETENDIQRADRIFVRRFLNHELKPRLEKRGFPVAGGSFNFVENTDLEALKIKLQIAEKIHTITSDGVDEDYFFEEFGLPRGKEKKENDAQSKEKGIHPPKNSNNKENEENEKDEQKRIKIIAKELTFFQKIKDFFDHAPL